VEGERDTMASSPARRPLPAGGTAAPGRDPARGAARPRVVAGSGRGIRWDRVGRVGLLIVLVGLLALYVGPARSYWSTRQEAEVRRTEVEALRKENRELRARRAALSRESTLEREARRLGMVRPGDRSFSVEGLPPG
jgi:cell division protein FtsB